MLSRIFKTLKSKTEPEVKAGQEYSCGKQLTAYSTIARVIEVSEDGKEVAYAFLQIDGDKVPEKSRIVYTGLTSTFVMLYPKLQKSAALVESVKCVVNAEGCISPIFKDIIKQDKNLPDHYTGTSGHLKYFQTLAGKKVKVTIEVLED